MRCPSCTAGPLLLQDLLVSVTSGSGSAEEQEAGLVAMLAWLRFSSSRLLTWNRNYNVKPREISAAQVSPCQPHCPHWWMLSISSVMMHTVV